VGGSLGILFGLPLSIVAVNKAVGATATLRVILGSLSIEVDQALGVVLSIVGILALASGIALCYVGFKLKRLDVACMILGSCSVVIPSMIHGLGYGLVAGIVAAVISYPTLFFWLTHD
jgi:hypothetical protein